MSKRILIVEDEFLIAAELEAQVIALGHVCVGPASTLAAALHMAETEPLHAALVNLMLAGEPADRLCELLDRKGIPFAFATGVDGASAGPWHDRPAIMKPYTDGDIRRLIQQLVGD